MPRIRRSLVSLAAVLGGGLLLSACHYGPGYHGAYRPHYSYGTYGHGPKYHSHGPRYRHRGYGYGRPYDRRHRGHY